MGKVFKSIAIVLSSIVMCIAMFIYTLETALLFVLRQILTVIFIVPYHALKLIITKKHNVYDAFTEAMEEQFFASVGIECAEWLDTNE